MLRSSESTCFGRSELDLCCDGGQETATNVLSKEGNSQPTVTDSGALEGLEVSDKELDALGMETSAK